MQVHRLAAIVEVPLQQSGTLEQHQLTGGAGLAYGPLHHLVVSVEGEATRYPYG